MADSFERPAARRRPRAAADETSDPMDSTGGPMATRGEARSEPAVPDLAPTPQYLAASSPPPAAQPGEQPRPPHVPVAPRPSSGAYVTLNVRVSPEIDQLIIRAMAEHGMTKRAAVEHALLRTFG